MRTGCIFFDGFFRGVNPVLYILSAIFILLRQKASKIEVTRTPAADIKKATNSQKHKMSNSLSLNSYREFKTRLSKCWIRSIIKNHNNAYAFYVYGPEATQELRKTDEDMDFYMGRMSTADEQTWLTKVGYAVIEIVCSTQTDFDCWTQYLNKVLGVVYEEWDTVKGTRVWLG